MRKNSSIKNKIKSTKKNERKEKKKIAAAAVA